MKTTGPDQQAHKLTTNQTDQLILNAATLEDGAIEDCEESTDAVKYFFESGAVGTVCRVTGAVEMRSTPGVDNALPATSGGELAENPTFRAIGSPRFRAKLGLLGELNG